MANVKSGLVEMAIYDEYLTNDRYWFLNWMRIVFLILVEVKDFHGLGKVYYCVAILKSKFSKNALA